MYFGEKVRWDWWERRGDRLISGASASLEKDFLAELSS